MSSGICEGFEVHTLQNYERNFKQESTSFSLDTWGVLTSSTAYGEIAQPLSLVHGSQ